MARTPAGPIMLNDHGRRDATVLKAGGWATFLPSLDYRALDNKVPH
jgi:hypothetical protein